MLTQRFICNSSYADSIDIDMTLVKTVFKTYNQKRASYNTKTDLEKEQNIIYKDKEEQ